MRAHGIEKLAAAVIIGGATFVGCNYPRPFGEIQPPPRTPIAGPAVPGTPPDAAEEINKNIPQDILLLAQYPEVRQWLDQVSIDSRVEIAYFGPSRKSGWVIPEEGLNERVIPDTSAKLIGAHIVETWLTWDLEIFVERANELPQLWANTWRRISRRADPTTSREVKEVFQTGFTALSIGNEQNVTVTTPELQPTTRIRWRPLEVA